MTQTQTERHLQALPQPSELSAVQAPVREMPSTSVDRLRLLWERRRVLKRALAVGLLGGTLLAFLWPKSFRSTTQLMPPDSSSGSEMAMAAVLSKSGSGLGSFAGDLLGLKSTGALFIGMLRNRTVEDRMVARFSLQRAYGTPLEEDASRKLEENTAISEDHKSGIITITVTDRDPRRAAAMAQAFVEELDHLVAEVSTSSAHRERVFLEERLTAVKEELDQATNDFTQFESKNAAIDLKEQGRAMVDAAATLMGQLIAAQTELRGLEPIYTSNNVRIQSVQSRIGELRRQLAKLGSQEGIDTGGGSAGENSPYPSIRKLPLLGAAYADLYRRTKIKEAVYETLTQEYELARVQEAKEMPSVRVLNVAKAPLRKSFPPRLVIIAFCTVLALLAASAGILGRVHWEAIDTANPGKALAQEVAQCLNRSMPWAQPNGSRVQAAAHRVWKGLARQNEEPPTPKEIRDGA